MAEAHSVTLAPHCPLGPIAFAASLQIDFATPNALMGNEPRHPLQRRPRPAGLPRRHQRLRLHRQPHRPTDRPPGLGIEIDEAAVRKVAEKGQRWRNPVGRQARRLLGGVVGATPPDGSRGP
ncbi:enolase C-terminal domain-like protein [Streptomyces decoyicus]